jgi:nitrite reductase (NADH) large subunit
MRYLVIGNGASGVDAAQAIRQNDPDGEIIILSTSRHPHYYRPKLVDYLMEDIPPEKLYILRNEALAAKNIAVRLSTAVASVDAAAKNVVTAGGETLSYDKLLFAVGSSPFMPQIGGLPLDGVFTLRGIEDADRIKAWCRGKKNIVISGAGLLGLETANALRACCESITVIDLASCLLSRQLDPDGAGFLREILEKKGMNFVFDDCVSTVSGDGKIESVTLRSGHKLAADALIVSAGVCPNTDLARRAGLNVDRGIVIDGFMQTSQKDIYAAGDCAEFESKVWGLWTVAKEQGRIAGSNMAGKALEYKGSVPSAILKVTGVDLYSAGDYMGLSSWSMMKLEDHRYLKVIYDEETPVGAIVIGDPESIKVAQRMMAGKAPLSEFMQIVK